MHIHDLGGVAVRGRVRLEPAHLLDGDHPLDERVEARVLDLNVCRLGAAVGQCGGAEAGIEKLLEGRDHIEMGREDGESGDDFGGSRLIEVHSASLRHQQ